MICSKCNTNNAPGAQFCAVCGATMTMYQTPVQPQMAPPPAPTYQAPPVYQQPMPQAPYQAPYYAEFDYEKEKMNWAAITGMVCGIISIFVCWIPYLGMFIGAGGIVFGGLGMKSNKRGFAIAGLACGIIAAVMSLIYTIGLFSY